MAGVDASADDHRDELPAELDATGYVGQYVFPDNRRRLLPGSLYLLLGLGCVALWLARGEGVLVNRGFLCIGVAFALFGAYHFVAAAPLKERETDALVAATRQVGFPVGHASAQLAWRGLRSRPTWRVLLYSADEPPTQRGFVLVDAVDGHVVQHLVEDNPEDWSAYT
jgi:hypothetical protein